MPGIAPRLAGLVFATAILALGWYAYTHYGAFADVARWTGQDALRPLRGWLTELRTPLMAAAAFLALSALSWVWQRLKLGH